MLRDCHTEHFVAEITRLSSVCLCVEAIKYHVVL